MLTPQTDVGPLASGMKKMSSAFGFFGDELTGGSEALLYKDWDIWCCIYKMLNLQSDKSLLEERLKLQTKNK